MPVVATLPLDLIILAIAALVLLVAGPIVAPFLAKLFSNIPLVGKYIWSGVSYWYDFSLGVLQWFLKSSLNPLTAQLHLIVIAYQAVVNVVGLATREVDLAADHIVNNLLPRYYNVATAYAANLYHDAINYSAYLVNGLLAYTNGLINGLLAYLNARVASIENLIGRVETWTQALVATALTDARNYSAFLINGLLAYVNSAITTIRADASALRSYVDAKFADLFHTVEADIASAEQRAEALALQYAKAALIDALGITDQAAVKALTDIWPHLATDLDALEHAIPAELTDIKDLILSIPRAIPTSLVDALSALGALAVPLIRYLEDCGIPLCKNLHGLSDLVDNLQSAAVDAAILALFAQMVADPHAAADEIMTVAGPVASASAHATRSLLGV